MMMPLLLQVLFYMIFAWFMIELVMRLWPVKTGYYGSITRLDVRSLQDKFGLIVNSGEDWVHLGWIADPDHEAYHVFHTADGTKHLLGTTDFGSYLVKNQSGLFEVKAKSKQNGELRLIGKTEVNTTGKTAPVHRPVISGKWQFLFKPNKQGFYINDHTIFQDGNGNWRLIGITSKTSGEFSSEKYFASGFSSEFPDPSGMQEAEPVADFNETAWAPCVIKKDRTYHLFWSPHRLEQMQSLDGISWTDKRTIITKPYRPYFRDPMVLKVGPNQWLLYTTARGFFFSRVDMYQSFDLEHWQYIRPAMVNSWGSECNSAFASTESPFVVKFKDQYYLSVTMNNGTFFWHGLFLMLKKWSNPDSYNHTRVLHSNCPYDFGVYSGKERTTNLVASLQAHAPEYVYVPKSDKWFITTAGWPWAATLTKGEAAVAPLEWIPMEGSSTEINVIDNEEKNG